ncbi:NUDIX hydrolase [Streptomyces sp. NPDC058953]|uniref:NUDIX hydrolase n=1 Tax=unclassified Streptomyces TaxID=2593676 RepID=UPI0036AE2F86
MTTAYELLRRTRPELFRNCPDGVEILFDPDEIRAARRTLSEDGTEGAEDRVGVVYSDRFITLVRDAVRFPGGALGLYTRVVPTRAGPGVVILPLLGPDNAIVVIEHYRHATRSWHWEVPRGMGEPGISGAESVARELREEIGAEAEEVIPLGRFHADTGLLGDDVELYAARISRTGPLDRAEGIRKSAVVSWAELQRMIATDVITDSFTIAVAARAGLRGLFGE